MAQADQNSRGKVFFLVSVPVEGSRDDTYSRMVSNPNINSQLDKEFKFEIPTDLRVGTLDTLVALSDQLARDDGFAEQLTRKLAYQLDQLLNGQKDKLLESLQPNGRTLQGYISSFRWDSAKFNTALSADALRKDINKKLTEIGAEMKTKVTSYGKVKSNLAKLEKKTTGTLITRDVSDLVSADQFVTGSEYLETLLVVVPKRLEATWLESYETLGTENVVPRSSVEIHGVNDKDSKLYTVTLFKRSIDDFKMAAREAKFVVKDFAYDEGAKAADEQLKKELQADIRKKFSMLVKWCSTMFSEAFIAWIHMKALRVFVESVLRYGLPVNFQAVLLEPKAKQGPKLRKALNAAYIALDQSAGGKEEGASMAGIGLKEYHPYVSFNLDIASFTA